MEEKEFNKMKNEIHNYVQENKEKIDMVESIKHIDSALKRIELDESKITIDEVKKKLNTKIDSLMLENIDETFNSYLHIKNQELNQILYYVKNEPIFFDNNKRLLSKSEIVAYRNDLNTLLDKIIPLIDLYDNNFVIYNIKDNVFQILDISNDELWKKLDSISNYLDLLKNNQEKKYSIFESSINNNKVDRSSDLIDESMIKVLRNGDLVNVNIFGKNKKLNVICTGDNKYDETGNYKQEDFELNKEEIEVLNWFLKNINIEDYREKIVEYCNNEYETWSDKIITEQEVENEIFINSIAINVCKVYKSNDGFIYPEISFYGECECDEEHGICIGFRDKKYLGIYSQDWTL